MFSTSQLSLTIFIISTLVAMPNYTVAFAQGSNEIKILPKDSKPYGLSFEDHVQKLYKLILSIPNDKNPMQDKTGERCAYGQELSNSSVFYLPGNLGGVSELTCRIPSGLGVFIQIIGVEASQAESPKATVEELHKIAKNDQDSVTSLYLKINDKEYSDEELRKYRTHTNEFDITFPKNAIFGASAGPSKVVADGFFVITEPLPKGNHTINFKGSLACLTPECLEPTFVTESNYRLIVGQ